MWCWLRSIGRNLPGLASVTEANTKNVRQPTIGLRGRPIGDPILQKIDEFYGPSIPNKSSHGLRNRARIGESALKPLVCVGDTAKLGSLFELP